jgi:hypothetical protein
MAPTVPSSTLARMGKIAPRPDRFRAWFRATFPYGAKQYAREIGVTLKTAENRAMGVLPTWREEDQLLELFGEAYAAPVLYPRLHAHVRRAEAEARDLAARARAARSVLDAGDAAFVDLARARAAAA